MIKYNKLVRDKIPVLIEAQGEKANYRILDSIEYRQCLAQKLDEEVREYHADQNPEELADILEVVFALAETQGISKAELLDIYEYKHETRGGFHDRIFLISKEG